jgi:hypothetical protein
MIGADRQRRLGALKLGMLASCGLAHPTAAIPLRNATTCCGAQDDDAQHDPSPGRLANEFLSVLGFPGSRIAGARLFPETSKVDASINRVPFQERVDPAIHLDQNKAIAPAYLRAAQAYILISMPTDTSTIFGAFQAILALLGSNRTNSALPIS